MLHFIVNRNSRTGEGSKVWKQIRTVLEENDVAYQAHVTEYEKHAAVIAGEICRQADGPVSLVVLGGDGSINEVINGVKDLSRLRLAVIPAGSGNDFAGGLGLSMDPVRQTERIIEAERMQDYEQIDLGVMADNTRARALYRRCGFEETGRALRAYRFDDGTYHDEILMTRILGK